MKSPNQVRGMTLIELMIVVVIVSILATIAVTSYRNYVIRANRVEGTSALLQVQVAQEKFFLQNNQYATNAQLSAAQPAGLGIAATTPNGNYTITLDSTATAYTATATAAAGQTGDIAACQIYTINESGTRTPDASTGCWK